MQNFTRRHLPLFSSQCPKANRKSRLSGFAFIASVKIRAPRRSPCKRNNSKCAWTYVASISMHRLNIRIASLVRFFFLKEKQKHEHIKTYRQSQSQSQSQPLALVLAPKSTQCWSITTNFGQIIGIRWALNAHQQMFMLHKYVAMMMLMGKGASVCACECEMNRCWKWMQMYVLYNGL